VILVDTGPLVAAAEADDRLHELCAEALRGAVPPRLVSGPVVAGVCYCSLGTPGAGAEAPFLRSFREGFLTLVDLTAADLASAAELVETYVDPPLDANA
jgi:predicted nucleic acid-binding protein